MNTIVQEKDRTPESAGFRPFLKSKFFMVIILLLLSFYWYANQLVLSINPDNNQQRVSYTTHIGDVWHIEFIHSVQKTPVQEYFVVRGADDLLLTTTKYKSLGVGLPFLPSEGKMYVNTDGCFVLEINRPFQSVKLRTGLEATPSIYYPGGVYLIYKMYEPGTLVEIKAEKRYKLWFN
ncbi:MAG: DUF1850 domain-containing protein [Acidaminococcaceae bacterium]